MLKKVQFHVTQTIHKFDYNLTKSYKNDILYHTIISHTNSIGNFGHHDFAVATVVYVDQQRRPRQSSRTVSMCC